MKTGIRPKINIDNSLCFGSQTKFDAIEYYEKKLEKIRGKLEKAKTSEFKTIGTAFVTFDYT
jgi:hypothetical protein